MTEDRHDTQIRDLVAELVASAPAAPPFSRITERLALVDQADRHGVRDIKVIALEHGDGASGDNPPPYVKDRLADRRHAKPWRALAALVALGLASAGGVFAYGSLSADDGTASPKQAVEQFVDAFGASDVAGMLESMPPSERVVLRESLESLNTQGARLRLTKDLDLHDVSGVHLEVAGLQLSSTQLGPDVAAVDVRGVLRSTANDRELPIGDVARDLLVDSLPDRGYQGWADAVDRAVNDNTTKGKAMQLVTVKEDGGWHVSLWYTLAEYVRKNAGVPMPNFGHSPIKPVGADSPEAAVRALYESDGDYTKAVGLAAPGESRVLYDYVPVLRSRAGAGFNAKTTVHQFGSHVDGDGDRRVVHVDSYDLSVESTYPIETSDGVSAPASGTQTTTGRVKLGGDCLTTSYTSTGATDASTEPQKTTVCRTGAASKGITLLQWDMATKQELTVERHDGRWFISPVRSLVGQTVDRLALVPDAKALKELSSSENTSALAVILPIDLLETALGSPSGGFALELLGASSSSTSSGSSSTSSGSVEGPVSGSGTGTPTTATSQGALPTSSIPAGSSATTQAPSGTATSIVVPGP